MLVFFLFFFFLAMTVLLQKPKNKLFTAVIRTAVEDERKILSLALTSGSYGSNPVLKNPLSFNPIEP